MTVKVIGLDMPSIMRRVVRRGHVDASVAQHHPHGLGRPCGLAAKGTVHVCGIVGGKGLCVRMRAQAEHVDLPTDTRDKIINRRVRIQPAARLYLRIPVGITDVGGANGSAVHRRRRSGCGGARPSAGGNGSGVVDLIKGLGARNAVRRQAVGLLEGNQRQAGLHAKVAVRLARQVTKRNQPVLQILYGVAHGAYPEGRGGADRIARRRGGVKRRKGFCSRNPVAHQVTGLLERDQRALGRYAKLAVSRARQVAKLNQAVLQRAHLHTRAAIAQGRGRRTPGNGVAANGPVAI